MCESDRGEVKINETTRKSFRISIIQLGLNKQYKTTNTHFLNSTIGSKVGKLTAEEEDEEEGS